MHPDHVGYFAYTPKSRLHTAISSLVGLIQGISIDGVINKKEISFLSEWVKGNDDLWTDTHLMN